MSSISNGSTSHTFISLGGGQPQNAGIAVAEITRPGVNGRAFRQEATRAQPFSLEGHVDVTNVAALQTTYAAMITAYQGKKVTVVDDYGVTHSNLICTSVVRVRAMPLIAAAGGISFGKGAYLVVRFDLVKASA